MLQLSDNLKFCNQEFDKVKTFLTRSSHQYGGEKIDQLARNLKQLKQLTDRDNNDNGNNDDSKRIAKLMK